MKNTQTKAELEALHSDLSSLFIGAQAENRHVISKLLQEFLGEHFDWRLQSHQTNEFSSTKLNSGITSGNNNDDAPNGIIQKTQEELHSLTSKLKHSAPIFSPQYLGNMSSDLMLPSLLAQIITTLYNPNNINSDLSETTIKLELEVGNQFAKLFGYNTDTNVFPCAWGHVTSGGSDANYEALWNYRAVKYYPTAMVEALKVLSLNVTIPDEVAEELQIKSPLNYSPWELINLTIDQVLNLRNFVFNKIEKELGTTTLTKFHQTIEENRLETIGPAQFFAEHYKCHQPVVLVPATAYDFWNKAMRLLGFGSASLIEVPVDQRLRMDSNELRRILNRLSQQNIPVLAVVGVVGTRDYGAVDPIHEIVACRNEYQKNGMSFYIHADASVGGYLKSIFISPDGRLLEREKIEKACKQFPSTKVYAAFKSLDQVDSITIAPHTLGYLPQGIGIFCARNREIVKLLNPSLTNLVEHKDEVNLTQLSHYILDGSKPGANATSAYVTHKVLPLHSEAFGRVMSMGIVNCQKLYNSFLSIIDSPQKIKVVIPFKPDTSVLAIAINPVGNNSFEGYNKFMKELSQKLSSNNSKNIQDVRFLTSTSSISLSLFSEEESKSILDQLNIEVEDEEPNQKNLILLRHSLNNPWLSINQNSNALFDSYCKFVIDEAEKLSQQMKI